MIDLHIHTNYSDGTDSLIEVLQKAESAGLEMISITDHDRVDAYEELEKIDMKQYYSGKIIKGIEIKCWYETRNIEILGYGIDVNKIQKWLNDFYKEKPVSVIQRKYFNKLYDICKEKGILLRAKNEIEWDPKKDWAAVTIHNEIKRNIENKNKVPEDLWESISIFSRKYTSYEESEFYLDKSMDYPSVKETIEQIKEAGGMSFLAHLYIYKFKNEEDVLNELVNKYKIDGIECFYSRFTQEQMDHLSRYCTENNLGMSGGTDYHGTHSPDLKLGVGMGNLNIESKIVKKWVKDIV